MRSWILLFCLSSTVLSAISPWYSEKKRGWYYFEEKADEDEISLETKDTSLETASQQIEEQKKKIRETAPLSSHQSYYRKRL